MHYPTQRVLRILALTAAQKGPLRLAEYHRALDIAKSTLLPILQTLCEEKYLYQNPDGSYIPGTALFSLGASFSGRFSILNYAQEKLAVLVDQLQETCYFGGLDGGNVLYLQKVDAERPVRVLADVGRQIPAYATGLGKALLMDDTLEALQSRYPNGLQPLTPATITDFDDLIAQLTYARRNGFTQEIEESTKDICCVGVPVRKYGAIVAAVSAAIPVFRYQPEQLDTIVTALQECAGKIGSMIEQTDAHFGGLF